MSAAAAAVPPLGLAALPDGVLEQVLGRLDLETRLTAAALVCKRWRELSVAPGQLQVVEALLDGVGLPVSQQRIQCFRWWLTIRAAPHVRRLHIVLRTSYSGWLLHVAEAELSGLLARLGAALAAVGGHRKLLDLSLTMKVDGPFVQATWPLQRTGPAAWPCALSGSLRRLRLELDPIQLDVEAPLQELSALEDLQLQPMFLRLGRGVAFPPSLTLLELSCPPDDQEQPPLPLDGLTRLADLKLAGFQLLPEGYAFLERLPSLRRLCLSFCDWCPASLGRLRQLTALCLNDTPYEARGEELLQATEAALAGLSQLEHLSLSPGEVSMPFPATALAAMTRLRHLCWTPPRGADPWHAWPALPAGGYLRSLRSLAIPATVAAPSLGVLAAGTTQLEHLVLGAFSHVPTAEQRALMAWVGAHPRLCHLSMEMGERRASDAARQPSHFGPATLFAVTGALQQRPALRLTIEPVEEVVWDAWAAAPAGLEEPWQLPDRFPPDS